MTIRGRRPWLVVLLSLLAMAALLVSCSKTAKSNGEPGSGSADSSPSSAPPTPTPTPSATTSAPPVDAAHRVFAAMTPAQRVGQLFMVGAQSGSIDPGAMAAITDNAVGSVIIDGNNTMTAAQSASIVAAMQAQSGPAKLFMSTDQEGGEVLRMRGPGFSVIPSALVQGTYAPATLRADAKTWGLQLAAAGINLDLAPVMDTVPSAAFAPRNAPIGAFDREFGFSPDVVSAHGVAFLQGLLDAGVDSTIKHFPGLGRVTGNTDVSSGVTDSVTTRTDAYLAPFAAGIAAGTPFVMMSTAIYSKIDPANPAAFSPTIVTGMLRGDLGFTGVIISDDLGGAAQVSGYPVGQRAVNFIAAGGDIVLTVDPSTIAPMTAAVLARAATDAVFSAQVDAAALVVLEAKQARGLLS